MRGCVSAREKVPRVNSNGNHSKNTSFFHPQAHLAHQEFMSRIGNVSPVHMHQLDQLASMRIKARRPIAIPDPIREELEQIEHRG